MKQELQQRKISISVLITSQDELQFLLNFNFPDFDVRVLVLSSVDLSKIDHALPFEFFLFDEKPTMPGYFKDLEEFLIDSDFIFLCSDYSMGAFQSARYCEKNSCPLFVIYGNTQARPFSNFKNVLVIRDLVQKVSQRYFVPSYSYGRNAIAEGLSPDKLIVFENQFYQPKIDVLMKRKKFREYIGFPVDGILIGVKAELTTDFQLDEILNGFGDFISNHNKHCLHSPKLIFIGSGSDSERYKNSVRGLELSMNVSFLEQDISLFKEDLYCSLDALIKPLPILKNFDKSDILGVDSYLAACTSDMLILDAEDPFTSFVRSDVPNIRQWSVFDFARIFTEIYSYKQDKTHLNCLETNQGSYKTIQSIVSDLYFSSLSEPHYEAQENTVKVAEKESANITKMNSLEVLDEIIADPSTSSQEYVDACLKKGGILRTSGMLDEASVALGMALQENPNNESLFVELGKLAMEGEAYDEAVTFFKQAYSINPNLSEALFGMGQSHAKVGLLVDALFWLERAVLLNPTNKIYAGTFAHTCLRSQDRKRMTQLLEKTIDTIGEEPNLCLALGRLYLDQGKEAKGSSLIQKGLKAS